MKVRVDLRDVRVQDLSRVSKELPSKVDLLLTSWQWSAWNSLETDVPDSMRVMVMVPDFLFYARLASTGQAREIINLPRSLSRLAKTALVCVPTGFRTVTTLARGNFWSAAEALLTYDIGLLERKFRGEIILHYNLTDFMWLFNRSEFLGRFVTKVHRVNWGVATQQLEMGLSACARWQIEPGRIMYPASFARGELDIRQIACGRSFPQTSWTVDMTQWPADLVGKLASDHMENNRADDEWLVAPETAKLLGASKILIS